MSKSYDFVVVGAGTIGRSTALYLAIQHPKAKCALIEQFDFKHVEGSSHSNTRIIRSTYAHPFYRDLCLEGRQKNWPQVQKLLKNSFIEDYPHLAIIEDEVEFQQFLQVSNTSNNIKEYTTAQRMERFPAAPPIVTPKPTFVDNKAGIVMAARYMNSTIEYLKNVQNVDLYENSQMISLQNTQKEVTLKLKSKNDVITINAKKVALSCGRWIGKLVPQVDPILKSARQTVCFLKMKNKQRYQIGNYPTWYHVRNGTTVYCLPDYHGDGVKFAVHEHDSSIEDKSASQQDFIDIKMKQLYPLIDQFFKGEYQEIQKVEKCYYTSTKTNDFLIDWTDQHQNVLIVSPCSGHGFKFSPILGKIAADLLEKDQTIQLFEKYRYLMRLFYHKGVNLE